MLGWEEHLLAKLTDDGSAAGVFPAFFIVERLDKSIEEVVEDSLQPFQFPHPEVEFPKD